MVNVLEECLNWMYDPVKSRELYGMFNGFTLSTKDLQEWGYPLQPSENGAVKIYKQNFWKHTNPARQLCRCSQPVSLTQRNWYYTPDGCYYHPGRREHGSFVCCGERSNVSGCTFSPYHVSSFLPYEGMNFFKTQTREGEYRTRSCNIYALDCEMVYTERGLEVAKTTVVGVNGNIVFDSYIKPNNNILDYNTPFSGLDDQNLSGVNTTLADVQVILLSMFNSDSILIGHGLENDLIALNLIHEKIIDTSVLFPHTKGHPYRCSLKSLASKYLQKSIQGSTHGHDSCEDAKTCMELLLWKIFHNNEHKIPADASVKRTSFLGRTCPKLPVNPSIPTQYVPSWSEHSEYYRRNDCM